MNQTKTQKEFNKWVKDQVEKYSRQFPVYEEYADFLFKLLNRTLAKYAPQAIVQTRPKSIASFAEKIQRRKGQYDNPVTQLTDLCGARVITITYPEVETICGIIRSNFKVDEDAYEDVSQRLKPTEFGYRSHHFIVEVDPEKLLNSETGNIKVSDRLLNDIKGLKAEIQVRTLSEHALSDFSHDRFYKNEFNMPDHITREIASVAALLETTDKSFVRILESLKIYESSYGKYFTKEHMQKEIELLETVLENLPAHCKTDKLKTAVRIGKTAISLEDWDKAIIVLSRVLSKYQDCDYAPLLKFLGIALCKKNAVASKKYKKGQKFLEMACEMDTHDTDAISSLANSHKKAENHGKAMELYKRAYEMDPQNPYSLLNYLDNEITNSDAVKILSTISPVINAAITRCNEQIKVGVNIPWSYFMLGKLYLYKGDPYKSIDYYAKAIQLSSAEWMIKTSFASIEKLALGKIPLKGIDWIIRLFCLALAVKFLGNIACLKKYLRSKTKYIKGTVVIVAGSCAPEKTKKIKEEYFDLIGNSFRHFEGNVISGGTTAGVCGLVGALHKIHPQIYTIGYIPKVTPSDIQVDKGYCEIRTTENDSFSPLEPLQYWTDLILSGIKPQEIKVIGIGGGQIAGFEYRLAMALGAEVGIIENYETMDSIYKEPYEEIINTQLLLPKDSDIIRDFIMGGDRENIILHTIAKSIHKSYQLEAIKRKETKKTNPAMADWNDLPNTLKQSNLQQAADIVKKIDLLGYEIKRTTSSKISKVVFSQKEIEKLAELEHMRWMNERFLNGWKYGTKKDVEKKINPSLLPWTELSEEEKDKDRITIIKIPEYLLSCGFIIKKLN